MTAIFSVQSPGPYTTVQDRGRFDWVHMGVPESGALDEFAFNCANLLVGNPLDLPVLEITFSGPRFEVLGSADIALTGAEMAFAINGVPVPQWRSLRVNKGDRVDIGQANSGCRGYIAVTGGIAVSAVMGSCSTYVSGGIGGIEGREIREGDTIERGRGALLERARQMPWIPLYSENIHVRAIPGPQDESFTSGLDKFFSSAFTVTDKANRMGYRLEGPAIPREAGAGASIISEPSIHGNVQVPPDGQPIILMVEQTIGGYAKIATIISSDLFKIAQARPGDRIFFHPVTLEEAHKIYHRWHILKKELETCFQ
jgi:antagonist of KipI